MLFVFIKIGYKIFYNRFNVVVKIKQMFGNRKGYSVQGGRWNFCYSPLIWEIQNYF